MLTVEKLWAVLTNEQRLAVLKQEAAESRPSKPGTSSKPVVVRRPVGVVNGRKKAGKARSARKNGVNAEDIVSAAEVRRAYAQTARNKRLVNSGETFRSRYGERGGPITPGEPVKRDA